jgi:hypothetical protein
MRLPTHQPVLERYLPMPLGAPSFLNVTYTSSACDLPARPFEVAMSARAGGEGQVHGQAAIGADEETANELCAPFETHHCCIKPYEVNHIEFWL